MANNGVKIASDAIQVLALEDIKSGGYIQFSNSDMELTAGTNYPTNFMVISNDTNYTMALSIDAANAMIVVIPNSSTTLNFSANRNANGDGLYLSSGTIFYGAPLNEPDTPAGSAVILSFFYTKII